jgi:UDP-hydrolysing UDP-N-acetyl-D-glucosamine 2-epimerase
MNQVRRIAIVTVARSDYGIYRPILHEMARHPDLEGQLLVGGAHLMPEYGMTIRDIEQDGYAIFERIAVTPGGDDRLDAVQALSANVAAFGLSFARCAPDLILVLGDRYEMFAAASAAVPLGVPLAHIHGGELTLGAMDDCFRHAITKLSHLHYTATESFRKRVIQMGEEPWRVLTSGAPALDNLRYMTLLSKTQLEEDLGIDLATPPLLITWHPETIDLQATLDHLDQLLTALSARAEPLVFTAPNLDMLSERIMTRLEQFVAESKQRHLFRHLGSLRYFSLLAQAAAMVGNSSSGIIEAASFKRPVVNIGTRQQGRPHGHNVIDCPATTADISAALERACKPAFRNSLDNLNNPYGDGHAAERIVQHRAQAPPRTQLLHKSFFRCALRPNVR